MHASEFDSFWLAERLSSLFELILYVFYEMFSFRLMNELRNRAIGAKSIM